MHPHSQVLCERDPAADGAVAFFDYGPPPSLTTFTKEVLSSLGRSLMRREAPDPGESPKGGDKPGERSSLEASLPQGELQPLGNDVAEVPCLSF